MSINSKNLYNDCNNKKVLNKQRKDENQSKSDFLKDREKQAIVNFLNMKKLQNKNPQEISLNQQKQLIKSLELPKITTAKNIENTMDKETLKYGKFQKYYLNKPKKIACTEDLIHESHYSIDEQSQSNVPVTDFHPNLHQQQYFSLDNPNHTCLNNSIVMSHTPPTPASMPSTPSPPIHNSISFNDLSTSHSKLNHTSNNPFISKHAVKHLKKVSEGLCVICGDRASGYHYNVLSCEGCKGFFRRTVTRKLSYKCKFTDGNCKMDMWMRRKCPYCRIKKCYDEGMKEDCLLTEHQCSIRNSRRKPLSKKKDNSRSEKTLNSADIETEGENEGKNSLMKLVEEQRELIERVVELQDQYELPTKDDLKLLSNPADKQFEKEADRIEAFFVFNIEMTILVTRLIVQFTKSLPGFKNLHREDQIVLLKASSSEVMMLRAARRYDPATDSIIFGNEMPFNLKDMEMVGMKEGALGMFEFSKAMSHHSIDNSEYGLLVAICIFSQRPGLKQTSIVEKLQDVYTEVLGRYVMVRRGKGHRVYLANLLMKLSLLRSIGFHHNQFLYKLTLRIGSLPPLLKEYFDV